MPYDFSNPAERRQMLRECVKHTVTNIRHYRRLGMPVDVIQIGLNCIAGLRRQHSSHFRRGV